MILFLQANGEHKFCSEEMALPIDTRFQVIMSHDCMVISYTKISLQEITSPLKRENNGLQYGL